MAVEALVHSKILNFMVVELIDQYPILIKPLLWLRSNDKVASSSTHAFWCFLSLWTKPVDYLSRHRAHVFHRQVVQRIILHNGDQLVRVLARMCLAFVGPSDCVVLFG